MVERGVSSAVHWIYEFSRDLELRRVIPGDSCWSVHRVLTLQDKIDHTEENCPSASVPRPPLD